MLPDGRQYRIALVVPNLQGGGAERVMVMLANGLARRGYDVDLVTGESGGPYSALVACGVRAINLGHKRMSAALPALGRYLRRDRPNAVLATLDWVNVLTSLAAALAFRPARLVLREASHPGGIRPHFPSLGRSVLKKLMGVAYRHADAVVGVSEGVCVYLVKRLGLDPGRTTTIYGPHFDDRALEQATEDPGHQWLNGGDVPVVVGGGSLCPEKDFPTLLRAFAIVRSRRSARLIILGDGPERGALASLSASLGISADVSVPGFVMNPFAVFARASVFVLSSKSEGLPGVLVQAMACGCPVVSTDCNSGPSEVLEGGRWGPLVPVGDPPALAEAMMKVLAAPPAGEELRTRAAAFSADVATAKYVALLDPEAKA